MAEYIEREALREILDGWRDAHADVDDVHGCGLLEDVICEVDAQTAADVAPVVRCKDCKHKGWVQEPCHGKSVDYCKIWDCTLRNLETTFCSYGERKDSGDG
mgnify:FL=1|jgi:hypothetical protein